MWCAQSENKVSCVLARCSMKYDRHTFQVIVVLYIISRVVVAHQIIVGIELRIRYWLGG